VIYAQRYGHQDSVLSGFFKRLKADR